MHHVLAVPAYSVVGIELAEPIVQVRVVITALGLVLFCISFPPIALRLGLWWDFLFLLGF